MENYIIIAIVVGLTSGIIGYLRKEKKAGKKCIGCPYSEQCSSKKGSCGCDTDKN